MNQFGPSMNSLILRRGLLPILTLLLLPATLLHARTLEVGPGRALSLPSQAAAVAQDGDTIAIDAGEYEDATNWTANNLVIRGVGGLAHVKNKTWGRKAIWVVQGDNTIIEWIEFSGAKVGDKNGAGIRQEGTTLIVRNCYFHHNEMGILTGADAESEIVMEFCMFAHNGFGDGYSHNIYIGRIRRFILRYCYSHDAVIGHNVKSRAHESFILFNRFDEADGGNTSREVDVPNGGLVVLLGNVFDHGLNTDNSNLVGYGMEGVSNPRKELYVINNTFVTTRGAGGFITLPSSGTAYVRIMNNLFVGRADVLTGHTDQLDSSANYYTRDIAEAGFQDALARDFHLRATSPAIDRGIDPGSVNFSSLQAKAEYLHPANVKPRYTYGSIDLGAFEYVPPVSVRTAPAPSALDISS
ncbi:MAG: hypothetical protein C0600_11550, partial [Ignavibacteria bacterium]